LKRRVLLVILALGSFSIGILAIQGAVTTWRAQPSLMVELERHMVAFSTESSQHKALQVYTTHLRSRWYRAQRVLSLMGGCAFMLGAAGMVWRARWARRTVLFGAWCAMAHMAWVMMSSLELYRMTGIGMGYQLGLLNSLWVILILTIFPMERIRVLIEEA
jgi:hypothetical protein